MTKISQWVTTMASKTPGSSVSFLDKPSLHMVGYMGKNPPSINAPHDGWCPVCKTKGQTQALKTYRLNFTQSIFLCTNPQCIYPLGYTPLDNVIANTADLKKNNSSLKKQNKRNFSDLSPIPLPCEKRPKTDLPNVGDSHTVQADLYKSLPGFPSLECRTSSPTSSHQREWTDASVSGTSNGTSALWDTSSFPMPTGSSSRYAPGQPDELPVVQDGHQEVSQNGDLEVMDTLNNGNLLTLPPETVVMANEVDKVHEKVMETTESVNDKHISSDLAFDSDHILPNVCPPLPLLQHSQQECQVKENSSKEVSISPSNIDAVSEPESGLPPSCELIKDGLRLVEPPEEQMEDLTDGDVEASCNKENSLLIQESPIKVSGNPVPSELQHEESDQQISPPTCPEAPVQEGSFGSEGLSESLQMMQGSGEQECPIEDCSFTNPVPSQLQHEESDQQISPPTCPEAPVQEGSFGSEGLSESLQMMQGSCEQECPIDCSFTHLWNPLSSEPCLVAEVTEKSQSTLPSCELEEYQTKSLSEDDQDTPLDLTIVLRDSSMVSKKDPSISAPNVSLLLELAQNCQKTNSEEHNPSNVLQDILPESQVEEKAVNTTSVPSVKVQACADAAVIPLPDSQLSEKFDTIHTCQKNDMATPAESLLDNQPVCYPDDDSLEKVREPHCPSVSVKDDDCDAKSLNKMSLPGPQILLQDCLKCHCGMNMPYPSLQKNACDNSTTTVSSLDQTDAAAISHDHSASVLRDDKSPNKMSPTGPQIFLRDCLKCHCGMDVPSQYLQNIQTPDKNSASEVGDSLSGVRGITDCKKESTNSDGHKDSGTVSTVENATVATTESPLSTQKKKIIENTILPDLLLDIQLEHRMEEPVLTAPSPACDAVVSVTPSDMDVTKQEVCQNGQVNESDNIMETEISIDTTQDGSKLSDTMETSLNSDGLEDDGNEAMEESSVDPAQDKPSPAKKLKRTERRLQWKNKHSLCWLDCILSALVQSETLNHFVAEGHISKESTIHNLITRYDAATEIFVKNLKKRKTDLKRPKYEKCLNQVRVEIFEKLKPLLKCKLGRRESPVFAFPLLLRLDPEIENLFMHSFVWEFKCEKCGYSYQQRCQKSLTTFTKILPEWHPLNAVHIGPCNKCQDTEQRRTMVLEQLNSVFMVHFVEGLPSNNLKEYAFQFQGRKYEVKTIIKYKKKHFSTWISNTDGTWLESDDLRGAFCRRYQKFMVRADDLHIVVWERNEKSFEDNVQFVALEQDSDFNLSNVSMTSEAQSFISVGAAELSQQVAPTMPPVALNASDALAGMEGYAADDVITLTLVEIPLDANGLPVEAATKPQPADTCTLLKEPNRGEDTPTTQPESQEDCTFTSPVPADPNAETVPLRNCSVVLSPLKPAGEAIATSTPAPQPYNAKKSIVGNWMTRLIKKDHSILNSDPLANKKILTLKTCPPLKVTDPSGAPRKAQNFNSFQGRSMSKMNASACNTTSKASLNVPEETPAPSASGGFRVPGSSGLDYGKLIKEGSSSEDKIRKLRLKLLKKLKAKKSELATLEMLVKRQQGGPSGVGFNRKEHLRGLLQELQEQIDNADNESTCTMSSSTSICSSPGDAEFFAELFSPPPVSSQPNDSKYLEMLADGSGDAAAGHVPQATSGSSHPCPNTSTPHNPKDESLNLMSNSTLGVLNEDNSYFDFDDYF